MTKAIAQTGIVTDIARVDPYAIFQPAYAAQFVDAPDDVQPGWLYDGSTFTAPPVQPATVPQSVTMRQARLALLAVELLDDVEAAVAAAGRSAQIEWEYATDVQRSHPLIAAVQAAKGLSDADVDALFMAASEM